METDGFGVYWTDNAREIPDKGDLSDYWREISSVGDFLDPPPSYTRLEIQFLGYVID